MTMVYTSTMEDKTLENAADIFRQIHDHQKERILKNAKDAIEQEKAEDLTETKIRRGPKKKYKLKVSKSKTNGISDNTAAYSKARKRVSLELMKQLFYKTRENIDSKTLWYSMK
ncbi:MAG: hypothetical protein ACYCVH_10320, partial [Ignavibacteriaceae bacterium]